MIELRTGVPGSGKTLSMVEALSKLLKRWEKHPEDARAIYVHNITDLALPHAPMPTKSIQMGPRSQIVPDWEAMETGSLVIIDECQDVFPPRSSQTVAPPHVAFLNTHRHLGFDLWLTTQNPKLIDFSVRALVNKHLHFRRLFGGQRAAVYEWDACSDSLTGLKDSVMVIYHFPKKAFEFYKSAEKHTKLSFKLPRWILIPVAGLALSVFAVPRAYDTISSVMSGKSLHKTEAVKMLPGPVLAASAPVPALVASAPVLAASAPVVDAPTFAGCIKTAKRCGCFDAKGLPAKIAESVCLDHLAGGGSKLADLGHIPEPRDYVQAAADAEVLAFMKENRASH